jgi:hypothetical protein
MEMGVEQCRFAGGEQPRLALAHTGSETSTGDAAPALMEEAGWTVQSQCAMERQRELIWQSHSSSRFLQAEACRCRHSRPRA